MVKASLRWEDGEGKKEFVFSAARSIVDSSERDISCVITSHEEGE